MNADKTKVFLTKFFIFFICVYLRSSAANNSLGCPEMGFGLFGMAGGMEHARRTDLHFQASTAVQAKSRNRLILKRKHVELKN